MNVQRSFPNSVFLQAGVLIAGSMFLCVVRNAYADHPPLPPEAYQECESKKAGDVCVAHMHGGDVNGTCAPDRDGGKLFCRPSSPPPPPPEAFDACSGKKESDECTVTFGSDAVKGTCRTMPDGRVACAPPHHGGNE